MNRFGNGSNARNYNNLGVFCYKKMLSFEWVKFIYICQSPSALKYIVRVKSIYTWIDCKYIFSGFYMIDVLGWVILG